MFFFFFFVFFLGGRRDRGSDLVGGMAYQCLQRRVRVVHQVVVKDHLAAFKQQHERAPAKFEVAQLLAAADLLTLATRDDGAADHHGADADDHDAAKLGRVDGHDDAHVLAVHVQRGADGHGVDRVVLAGDRLGLAHDAVDGDVEAVVVLRREAEHAQGAAGLVAAYVFGVCVAEEPLDAELAALDPNLGGRLDAVKHDGAAVGGRHDDARVVGRRAGARGGLERPVEKLVEALELVEREQYLGEIEAVEGDELGDLGLGRWVVVLFALLDAEALEEFADYPC